MEKNYFDLEEQVKNQYSLSKNIIQNFNKTVENIQHNQEIIKRKIEQLFAISNNHADQIQTMSAKDVTNQLIIAYNTILNIFDRIEDSISFCKLKVLHPSVINSNDLFNELIKISKYYSNQLPFEITQDNILNIESLISVNCKIEKSKITYFISIPINYEKEFELIFLLPIPTKTDSKFVTIIPEKNYFLKSIDNGIIRPLNDVCMLKRNYQCPSNLLSNVEAKCEKNIILHDNTTSCKYTTIDLEGNHIEIVPEINQFLAIFKTEETLKFNCKQQVIRKSLQGIFLIKNTMCKVYFKDNELTFNDQSLGKPSIVKLNNLKLNNEHLSDVSVNLKTIKLNKIENFYSKSKKLNSDEHFYRLSVWTIILYVLITSIIIHIIWTLIKSRLINHQAESTPVNQEDIIELPGGAPF